MSGSVVTDEPRPPTNRPHATARDLSGVAATLYAGMPRLQRWLATYRPYICPFEALVPVVPMGSRLLDIGCGIGLFGNLLAVSGRVKSVVGFDSNEEAIRMAQGAASQLKQTHPGLTLDYQHNRVEEPWPDGLFDVVSIIDVIHHVPKAARRSVIEQAIGRLERNTAQDGTTSGGGLLLYKDMVDKPAWRAWANKMHDRVLANEWIQYEPIEQIEAWCGELGCELVMKADLNRWWYGHELRVFRPKESARSGGA